MATQTKLFLKSFTGLPYIERGEKLADNSYCDFA